MNDSRFLLVELTRVLYIWTDYSLGDAPNFVSAFGFTVLCSAQLNDQLYEVVVSSHEMLGNQAIRILVPHDYSTSGSTLRHPVLYLLRVGVDVVKDSYLPSPTHPQDIKAFDYDSF